MTIYFGTRDEEVAFLKKLWPEEMEKLKKRL